MYVKWLEYIGLGINDENKIVLFIWDIVKLNLKLQFLRWLFQIFNISELVGKKRVILRVGMVIFYLYDVFVFSVDGEQLIVVIIV